MPRKNIFFWAALALLLFGGGDVLAGLPQSRSVRIFNWSDYIGKTTLTDFTKTTGIRTFYDVYDNNFILESRLNQSLSDFDIVVPTAQPFFSRQIKAGMYQPLKKEKIPNLRYLDPALMAFATAADPGNTYGVIYQWGTNGVAYNSGQVRERMADAPITSWAMLFEPAIVARFASCGVTFLDDPSEVVPSLLRYLKRDPNSQSLDDLKLVEERLKKIRPYIRSFHSSNYIEELADGKACLSLAWSGDAFQADARAKERGTIGAVRYSLPEEGAPVWFDMMAIPKNAPNPDAAHAFINFILDPRAMGEITNTVGYGNAIPASKPYLKNDIKTNRDIFPPPEVRSRLFSLKPVSKEFDEARKQMWARIKGGRFIMPPAQ